MAYRQVYQPSIYLQVVFETMKYLSGYIVTADTQTRWLLNTNQARYSLDMTLPSSFWLSSSHFPQ